MTIDWTQPVIDARDMDADPLFDSQGRVQACRIGSVVYASPAFEKLGLRNVAPPKPETSALKASLEDVTRQRDDATAAIKEWRTKAEEALSLLRTANDRVEALQAKLTATERGVCGLLDDAREGHDRAETIVAQMKPVVDAAVAWADRVDETGHPDRRRLYDTVRAYRSKAPAVEQVKNCTTCRHYCRSKACVLPCGSRLDMWEPCHD